MKLKPFSLPGGWIVHHFVDVHVIFSAVLQGRVDKSPECGHEHGRGQRDLDSFRFHNGLRESHLRIPCLSTGGQSTQSISGSSFSSRYTVATGNPTTFDQDPSIRSMNRAARP